MARVVVTGGSGKLGRACVKDLVEHGYEVINGDIFPPKESQCPFFRIDFENMAQTIELLSAMDFVRGAWTQLFTWQQFRGRGSCRMKRRSESIP